MDFVTRIEQIGPEHIEPYIKLSKAEYGDAAAVSKSEHLRWKFIENPQGSSTGIHLYDASGELVGRMTALTRRFLHGKDYRAAHIVDFLVHPKMRGMPALFQLATGLKKLSGFDLLLIMAPNPAGATIWEKLLKMRSRFDLDIMAAPLRPFATLQAMGKLGGGKVFLFLDWSWQLLVGSGARSPVISLILKSKATGPDRMNWIGCFLSARQVRLSDFAPRIIWIGVIGAARCLSTICPFFENTETSSVTLLHDGPSTME